MTFGNITLRHGLMLGPMAGYTDRAMRLCCRRQGAEYTVTEMVSAKAICYGDKKTPSLARIDPEDTPCAVQIFGSDPAFMAEAARRLEAGLAGGAPPAAIDINMGCPVPKVAGNGDGSALLQNPALAGQVVAAVVKAVSLPVTVKIRIGWNRDHLTGPEVAQRCEDAGAVLLAVHGRTRAQMYSGMADLEQIARVKDAVHIPVVGNGDIRDAESAKRMLLQTGCDGLMIARGAVGNPYVFREVACMMDGLPFTPPTLSERLTFALEQLSLAAADKGERVAVNESRKQLAEVIRGIRGAAELRGEINRTDTLDGLRTLLAPLLSGA